jgi:hypothetical protein
LRSLHAIPITGNPNVKELNEIIRAESLASNNAGLLTLPDQLIPSDVIRGSLGKEIIDYVSGSRLAFAPDSWTRAELNQERVRRWWMQCLPIPTELRAERNATPELSDEGTAR